MDNIRDDCFDGWTLFAIPKTFDGLDGIRQRNALTAWTYLEDLREIILLGDDPGVSEFAEEMDMRHIPEIRMDEHRTPLISSIFQLGQQYTKTDVVCYANSDVILLDMGKAIRIVSSAFPEQFLAVGQRWDIDLDELIDFRPGWKYRLARYILTEGTRHSHGAVDYFAFRRGLYRDIPPFSIGRSAWDNWLVSVARDCGVPIIDLTPSVLAIHQDKPRPPLIPHSEEWWGQHQKNQSLYRQFRGRSRAVSSANAHWVLQKGALVHR